MGLLIRCAATLVLLLASTLSAQPAYFGRPFPLTETRYGTVPGTPVLASNGRDVVLFWVTDQRIRATRVVAGEARVSRYVLDVSEGYGNLFDAIWTGRHFLVVSRRAGGTIGGRLVDTSGEPISEAFSITPGISPHVAFDGRNVLLVYLNSVTGETESLLLNADGQPIESTRQKLAPASWPWIGVASNGTSFGVALTNGTKSRVLVLDSNGVPAAERELEVLGVPTLGSDGRRYLAVFAENAQGVHARLIDTNGSIVSMTTIESPELRFFRAPHIAWSGTDWAVTYSSGNAQNLTFHVARLNASAQLVTQREERKGENGSLVRAGNRVVAAFAPGAASTSPISITDLPLATNVAFPASYGPAQQTLLTTTSSLEGTLVVWRETIDGASTVRSGVRTFDGRWSERQIASSTVSEAFAASDGREFVVVLPKHPVSEAIRLDANGEPYPGVTEIRDFSPKAIAWNGTAYGVIGTGFSGVTMALLSPQGTLSMPSVTGPYSIETALASNGSGFYAAWGVPQEVICTCPPASVGVAGVRVRDDLQRIDPTPLVFAQNDGIGNLAAAWDGAQYTLVWHEWSRVRAAQVSSANTAPVLRTIGEGYVLFSTVAPMPRGVSILWRRHDDATHRFAYLDADGTLGPTTILDRNVTTTSAPAIVAARAGDVAYVYSARQDGAPYQGASRIMMTIGSPLPLPALPEAPRAKATTTSGAIIFEWTRPEQQVHGYRVEYRVNDGTWNELGIYPPHQAAISFITRPNSFYAFRVRAWNDAGMSAYSEIVTGNIPKRRAVR